MEIKDIMLVLQAGEPCEAALSIAARLAREHDAQVAGRCVVQELEQAFADCFAIGPEAVGDVLEHRETLIRNRVQPTEAAFTRALAQDGLSGGWSLSWPDEPLEATLCQARLADLVVMGRPRGADRNPAQGLFEKLALFSGTPCLLAPGSVRSPVEFKRVLLAWNGGREAKRALDDGLEFLRCATSAAVVIVEDSSVEWIDRAAEKALLDHLMRHGVRAELKRVQRGRGRDGRALLDTCDLFGADLLIMGAYSHSRAAEIVLGGATRTMLTHAPIPVLMSH